MASAIPRTISNSFNPTLKMKYWILGYYRVVAMMEAIRGFRDFSRYGHPLWLVVIGTALAGFGWPLVTFFANAAEVIKGRKVRRFFTSLSTKGGAA